MTPEDRLVRLLGQEADRHPVRPDRMSDVYRRGAQIRRRRRWLLTGGATAAVGAVAAALVLVISGPTPQRLRVVGLPLPASGACPASAFAFSPLSPPQGGLETGPGLANNTFAHLQVGQSAVLYEGPGQSITLTRGVSNESFSVSLYAHGPKPLDEIQVLGAATYYYPPGDGSPGGRIPFRFPSGLQSNSDPCDRYQLVSSGVDEPSLMATAERFHALAPTGTPTTTRTAPGTAQPITVPNVVGLQPAQAVSVLGQAGLIVAIRSQSNSSAAPNTVFQESPIAGSRVPRGALVELLVSGVALQDVDWAAVQYPVSCGGTPTATRETPLAPGPGSQLELVFVQCVHGAGSPPSAALVYDYATSATTPHLEQALFTYQDDWSPVPGGVASNPPELSIRVDGYTGRTPRCCPDIQTILTWTWTGTSYRETSSEPPHTQLPAS